MDDTVAQIVLGVAASAVSAALGWFARRAAARRALRRRQRFFGLPRGSECLLVVNQDAGAREGQTFVARGDVFALLELSALIKECGANVEMVAHDAAQPGIGGRTEFCVGGPLSNRRAAAHLAAFLPGVRVEVTDPDASPPRTAFTIGGETYEMRPGEVEYALLARVAAGEEGRPVFLACGQRAVDNQAAVRYLARHHRELARGHGRDGTFCLLLRVRGSRAYGPDLVEVVGDVTRQARTAPAQPPGDG
jgi:hypothetical protein